MERKKFLAALWGSIVGDALGVPVEFTARADLQRNPVTDMRGWGTHQQPPGTWSDDSSLTHAHPISRVGCYLFVRFALAVWAGADPQAAYRTTVDTDLSSYPESAVSPYRLVLSGNLPAESMREIASSGYVAHTLPAALWAVLRGQDYAGTVLCAVNLGEDTDTTGAVAGLLAGLIYGLEAIPASWRQQIANPELIESITDKVITRL